MVRNSADPRKALSTRGVPLGDDRSAMNRVPAILSSLLLVCLFLLPWNVHAQIEATEGACNRASTAIDVECTVSEATAAM